MATIRIRHQTVREVTATVGGTTYRLKPSSSCKGCVFEADCYAVERKATCPTFGGKQLSICLNAIYVPLLKTKAKSKKKEDK